MSPSLRDSLPFIVSFLYFAVPVTRLASHNLLCPRRWLYQHWLRPPKTLPTHLTRTPHLRVSRWTHRSFWVSYFRGSLDSPRTRRAAHRILHLCSDLFPFVHTIKHNIYYGIFPKPIFLVYYSTTSPSLVLFYFLCPYSLFPQQQQQYSSKQPNVNFILCPLHLVLYSTNAVSSSKVNITSSGLTFFPEFLFVVVVVVVRLFISSSRWSNWFSQQDSL